MSGERHTMTGVVASPRQTVGFGDHMMHNRGAATYEQDTVQNSYQEYPSTQPFINDTYRRAAQKPVTPYPESNRQAVMSALRGLQEKIRQLELDRTQAESNLRTLAKETTRYRDILQDEHDATNVSLQSANISASARDVHTKLGSAEKRCVALEKQLDQMREMVKSSGDHAPCPVRHRPPVSTATASLLDHHRMQSEQREITAQLSKISELERAQMKLTATQTLAENKIRELEEKLREERHHRKLMQQKASELEAAAASNRILQVSERPKKTKKKRKCVPPGGSTSRMPRPVSSRRSGSAPKQHFKLKIGDIPFIGGTSVGPSHSVPANFQEVLSLMKSHNNQLCESPRNATYRPPKTCRGAARRRGGSAPRSLNSNGNCNGDLTELLLQLQDEFGAMSFEHQELSRQIEEATDVRLRDDLERDLELLVASMEAKGEQIARLRRHQEKLLRRQTSKRRPSSAASTISLPTNGKVEVVTTIKTSGGAVQEQRTTTGGSAGKTLNLLRNLQRIQTTLRKDDLSWDC